MPTPLPPVGLPPPVKPVTRLLKRPMYLAIGVGALLVTTAGYAIINGRSQSSSEQADTTPPPQTDNNTLLDAFRNAPSSAEIAARQHAKPKIAPPPAPQQAAAAPTPTPAPTQAITPPPIPDDMTDAAIAMRRAAWAAYSQQLADMQQKRLERARTSMGAELVETTPVEPAATAANNATSATKAPTDFFSANASNPATDYSPYTLTAPISPYEIKATDIVTSKLESQIDSDRPGIIRARVTKNVLDHATGTHILIPQGAILKGVYDTSVSYGQTDVTTAWQRIIYPAPCDQSLDLGAMPGSDQTGKAGFEDMTDNHLAKVFGAAILVSVFGAASQLSQPAGNSFSTYSPTQTISSSIGQQTSQLGTEFARKGLSIPPTQRVRQGYSFTIMVTKDIAFEKPWVEGVCEPMEVASQ